VVYLPTAAVIHHGGASFAQAMTLKKQRYFTASMGAYFKKHRGAWTLVLLAVPMLIGLGAAASLSLWKTLNGKR
jgi:hypothetical protein